MTTNPRIKPIEAATDRSWDEWVRFMDSIGAEGLNHRDIALKVHEELEPTMEQAGWWAQSVTVAYEQYIGRRLPGQRSDGTFQLSVSKSTALAMEELMEKWAVFAAGDETVQDLIDGEPRVSGTDRRITWRTKAVDESFLIVTSEPKKNGTASLVVTQMGLPTPESNDDARKQWAEVVARFLDGVQR